MDVNGTAGTPAQLEHNVSVTSPSISGDLTKLYVVYRKGTENKIRTKYSSDGGTNWSYISDLNLSGTPSLIECVFVKNQLHITYLVGTTVYHAYYKPDALPPIWSTPYPIYGSNPTSDPRIAALNELDNEQVFVTYTNNTNFRWTRYDVNATQNQYHNWYFHLGGVNDINLGIGVDDQYVYGLFKEQTTNFLQWSGKYWSESGDPINGSQNNNYNVSKMFNTATADNRVFSACWSGDASGYIARLFFDHSDEIFYDEIYSDPNLTPVGIVNLSAAGNDIHVIWKDNLGTNNGNNLRYKYYDDYPIPPQNLTITEGILYHPQLEWIAPVPDIDHYIIEKDEGNGWDYLDQSTDNTYLDVTKVFCHLPYKQCYELVGYRTVSYRVYAVDNSSLESGYSNTASSNLLDWYQDKITADPNSSKPSEYSLSQNYPNPFNPTTTINYSIKSTGLVTLKIYDMLGIEVASLVNERKEPGNYSVTFNVGNLPSGIYIYVLAVNDFTSIKKLMLVK